MSYSTTILFVDMKGRLNMELLTIEDKREILLDLLNEINRIFNKHGIRYYLAYGTLLGAIRHKGFIPWDDDIDIWVFGRDYVNALEILSKESKYSVISNINNKDWPREFSKLSNPNTLVLNNNKDMILVNRGIAVDIFPLSFSDNYLKLFKKAHYYARSMYCTYAASNGRVGVGNDIGGKMKLIYGAMNNFVGHDVPYWQRKMSALQDGEETLAEVGSFVVSDIYLGKWFNESISISFEGKDYPAPAGYREILDKRYGNDWFKIPPKEKRVSNHDVRVCWVGKE